jgi:hypothetical protein
LSALSSDSNLQVFDITPPPIPSETDNTLLLVRESVRTYCRLLEPILLAFESALRPVTFLNSPRLLGRTTAGFGSPEQLTVGSPLTLAAGALSFDQTVALGNNARVAVSKNSAGTTGTRRRINLIEGGNITLTVADDAGNEEIDVTIAAAGAGGLLDGDYGDIVLSGGAAVWTIDNDAVTYAKMQNISAASRILGRGADAGAGDPEEILLGSGLTLLGATLAASASGSAGGDLGDTYPNPSVREVENALEFTALRDDFEKLLLWTVQTFGEVPPDLESRFEKAVNG